MHYQDWEWNELKQQVDEAHDSVLKEYKAKGIYKGYLQKKYRVKTLIIDNIYLYVVDNLEVLYI